MENMMTTQYHAYLLRIWRVGKKEWRILLENPHTHQLTGFASLETVCLYLQDVMHLEEIVTPNRSDPREDIP
jgi:hypothetical protein